MNVEERHRAATAEFSAATAAYEAALMSGDDAAIDAADKRLDAADRAFNETLAALVAEQARAQVPSGRTELRKALPSFVEMLAHPWCQPAERAETSIADVVYGAAVAQSAGLPVVARSAAVAGSNPHRYQSEAWNAAYNDLIGGTVDRHAPVG